MAELVTKRDNTQRMVVKQSYLEPDLTHHTPPFSSSSCRDAEGSRWPAHYREQTVLFSLVQTWRRASPDSICSLSVTDRVWHGRFKGLGSVCVYISVGCWGACWTNTSGDLSGMEWRWPAITWVHLCFGVFLWMGPVSLSEGMCWNNFCNWLQQLL